ncbi:MAG: DUF5916 domain-containing protein [Terriglobales bacterium]
MHGARRKGKALAMVCLLFGAAGMLSASDAVVALSERRMRIPRVQKAPVLQDFLDRIPREAELAVSDFRQREPGDGVPISQTTTVYLSYDDKNLYAVFVCKDDPLLVRANLTRRDNPGGEDGVAIILDTFHDHRRGYMFWANPLGIQSDSIIAEDQADDYTFDAVWHSDGRLTDDGYIVWMAIPFRSLRFARRPVQEWGILLMRSITRNNESAFAPYLTRRIRGTLQQAATLEGVENVTPGRNVQFIPYVFAARARTLDPNAPAVRNENDFRGGVDAKFVLHNALSLDVTVNPDFSQVESDEPQVTINRRYEVYFPERRPFFIENSDFFKTPETLFFSRRIADPEFGTRLTGSIGRWKIGALAMDDRAAGLMAGLPETDPRRDERAVVGVARVRREFLNQSSIGLLFTSRDFAGSFNRLFAIDTRLALGKHWTITGQAIGSNTEYLDGTTASGPEYSARVDYSSRTFSYYTSFLDRSPNFHTDLGFVTRTDMRKVANYVAYTWRPKRNGFLLSYRMSGYTMANWDHAGTTQDWVFEPEMQVEFPRQTYVGMDIDHRYERYAGIGFREHWTGVWAETSWLKWLTLSLSGYRGQGVNYYPAEGMAPFPVRDEWVSASFILRPKSNVNLSQSYLWYHDATLDDSAPGISGDQNVFTNHIARTKVNWQFSRRLSVRTIVDYNAVLANTSLIYLANAKRLTGDVLVKYMVNPWTAVYVGYSDLYENLSLREGRMVRTKSPTVPTGRQVFVKLSYLLQF